MCFIFQVFKAFCYGCSNLGMTQKSKHDPKNIKKSKNNPKMTQGLSTLGGAIGQQRGFPRGSISSLGALGGVWIWI